MSLNAKKIPGGGGAKRFRQPPLDAGTYPARLVQVLGLGTQKQRAWEGQEKDPKFEIYTTYELLDEFVVNEEGEEDESKPRWMSERLPLHSLDSDLAKSTKRYYSLDPTEKKGGDWSELVGTACMLTITKSKDKKGKTDDNGEPIYYNNIGAVQPMRDKDAKKAEGLKNDPKVFDPSDPDMEVYFSLPDWIRDIMKEALDFEGSALDKALEGVDEKEEVKSRRSSDEDKPSEKQKEEESDGKEEDSSDDDW